ncbi:MAG: enoyl-CoA hydratase/isomerase family protein [Bacteroidetes bacterium]|nr:enoyl-CoA hydratase/isomerase family protein [Bacteroidota bacterium]
MAEITKYVKWETIDSIGILTLNNPPENYLEEPEFIPVTLLQTLIEKNLIKGMVIHGIGRHFSGGADLASLFEMTKERKTLLSRMDKGNELLHFIENLNVPVIAAVRGCCFGAGLEIALACHIRVCDAKSLFAFPESNQGLIPGLGGIVKLARQTSNMETMQFVLQGDLINAMEALTCGIVDHIIQDEDPMEYAVKLLHKMTDDRSMKVIHYVMQALRNSRTLSFDDAVREETKMFCELAVEEAERRFNNEE